MTKRLVTLEERRRHNKIDEYCDVFNKVLIALLLVFSCIILYGWIMW